MSSVEIHKVFKASGLRAVPTVEKCPNLTPLKKIQYTFIVRLFDMSTILPEISWLIVDIKLIFNKNIWFQRN